MEDFLALAESESQRLVAKQIVSIFFLIIVRVAHLESCFSCSVPVWPCLNLCAAQRNCQASFLSMDNYLVNLSTQAREQLLTLWQCYTSKGLREVLAVKAVWAETMRC